MVQKSESWGIVGGGILGMTLALRLAQQGQEVTLFEGANHLGGLASAWKLGDILWDRHYHVTLLSDACLRGLLTELGLEPEMRWVQTRTGFYTEGKLYSMSNSVEFLRFPPLRLRDKLRLALTIMYASRIKDWRALEQTSVVAWLTRWSGPRTTEKIWLPLLRAKLGQNYEKTSAAFIWATISRMYAARRSGLKKEMFGYLPGGYARVLQRLSEALVRAGVAIKLDHKASAVKAEDEGGIDLCFSNGETHQFDRVVLTVPAPAVADLCPQLTAQERARAQSIEYQGILCASVLLRKPLAGFYVTNITDSGLPFTAVIEMSALVDREQFGGNALVYLPKYVPSNDPFFNISDEDLKSSFISALSRMYPSFDPQDVLSFQVSRVRQVFAIPTLGYSARVPAMNTSQPGIHVVNSAQILNGTLNVNETIQLAERAVPKLLSATTRRSKFASASL
jgi:protoporphyrinogen oxidase